MLPCGECGFHLLMRLQTTSLSQNPASAPKHAKGPQIPELACASRADLVRTLATIHNGINAHNNKNTWSLAEVENSYKTASVCLWNNSTWNSDASL